MRKFVNDVTGYLIANLVDGFDIDWEFPVWSADAQATDRKGFAILIKVTVALLSHLRSSEFFYTNILGFSCGKAF